MDLSLILLFKFGGWEIVLIAVAVLLFFGGKKIPELMRGLGKGVREFKDGISADDTKKDEKSDTK